MHSDIIHQKVIDDQLFVGSYQSVSDTGRYDKVENLENPAGPVREGKTFRKK
jgi:hypothetical protein